jgi:hypothetical protein
MTGPDYFSGDLHAYVTGFLLGDLDSHGVIARPVYGDGSNYTAQISITVPGLSEPVIITVEPPHPDQHLEPRQEN